MYWKDRVETQVTVEQRLTLLQDKVKILRLQHIEYLNKLEEEAKASELAHTSIK